MSKRIDFSKAPQGATHYNPAPKGGTDIFWYRKNGPSWEFFVQEGYWWKSMLFRTTLGTNSLLPIPPTRPYPDFTKVPEGATHYDFARGMTLRWYRCFDHVWQFLNADDGWQASKYFNFSAGRHPTKLPAEAFIDFTQAPIKASHYGIDPKTDKIWWFRKDQGWWAYHIANNGTLDWGRCPSGQPQFHAKPFPDPRPPVDSLALPETTNTGSELGTILQEIAIAEIAAMNKGSVKTAEQIKMETHERYDVLPAIGSKVIIDVANPHIACATHIGKTVEIVGHSAMEDGTKLAVYHIRINVGGQEHNIYPALACHCFVRVKSDEELKIQAKTVAVAQMSSFFKRTLGRPIRLRDALERLYEAGYVLPDVGCATSVDPEEK